MSHFFSLSSGFLKKKKKIKVFILNRPLQPSQDAVRRGRRQVELAPGKAGAAPGGGWGGAGRAARPQRGLGSGEGQPRSSGALAQSRPACPLRRGRLSSDGPHVGWAPTGNPPPPGGTQRPRRAAGLGLARCPRPAHWAGRPEGRGGPALM